MPHRWTCGRGSSSSASAAPVGTSPARSNDSIPRSRRGLRRIDAQWQNLAVGDVIPDWGGKDETFTVARFDAPLTIVHTSTRGKVPLSWAITLSGNDATRVHLRLRLGGVKHRRLAELGGGFFDWLTIYGLAAGLRERLRN